MINTVKFFTLLLFIFFLTGCPLLEKIKGQQQDQANEVRKKGKTVIFIGVDISGSFMRTRHFKDSLRFLSHYVYAHLNGYGDLDIPAALFIGTIGGSKPNEPKTFYPIQTFEHRSIKEIDKKLFSIFPKEQENPFTDYNAFFEQIATTVRNKNLVLKPISIILLSDGIPDAPKIDGKYDYRSINLDDLETLARDVTIRILYTSAPVGMNWQTKIPRKRVKIWSQDANVMRYWSDKKILLSGVPFPKQDRFFEWIRDNVDFKVRLRRVD